MISTNLRAKRTAEGFYILPIEIGGKVFDIKLDLGAGSTVISLEFFTDEITDEQKQRIIQYIKNSNTKTSPFKGATGHEFTGYLIHAKSVVIGDLELPDFYYYVIPENKRIISLLGADFLEYCGYQHKPNGEFTITDFDFEGYIAGRGKAIEYEDIVEFVDDMLSEETHVN